MLRMKWLAVLCLGLIAAPTHLGAEETGNTEDLVTLRQVMEQLAYSTGQVSNALWRDDFETIVSEGRAIAKHGGLSRQEAKRIMGTLGPATVWFTDADAKVSKAALEIVKAAERKDADQVADALAEMQNACVTCHSKYRQILRK